MCPGSATRTAGTATHFDQQQIVAKWLPVAEGNDSVGLWLHPPENAVVLCVDQKSQIQAPHCASSSNVTGSSWPSSTTWSGLTPTQELHVIMDSYTTHNRVEVRDRLAANLRVHAHFTPISGFWLNLVEVWFGIIERPAIRRGRFPPCIT